MIKKVLVTGAGGFIGSHLCEILVDAGYEVHAFVKYNSRNFSGWLDTSKYKDGIILVSGDIRDYDQVCAAVSGVDAVCHLAALIGIPYSYRSPLAYIRTNIEGTYNVLEAARHQGKKPVVQTSTSETYGTAQYVPIDENHPLVGQSPYSASKIGADQLAYSYSASFDLPVTTIRPFNTFGPRQSMRAVIPTIIAQVAAGKKEIELGNLTATRDFTFVSDTAAAFVRALESRRGVGRTINLGSGKDISIGDLASKIFNIMSASVKIISSGERHRPAKSEVERLQSDNSLAKTLLSWEPEVSLEEGLRKTIEFVRLNISSFQPNSYVV